MHINSDSLKATDTHSHDDQANREAGDGTARVYDDWWNRRHNQDRVAD